MPKNDKGTAAPTSTLPQHAAARCRDACPHHAALRCSGRELSPHQALAAICCNADGQSVSESVSESLGQSVSGSVSQSVSQSVGGSSWASGLLQLGMMHASIRLGLGVRV